MSVPRIFATHAAGNIPASYLDEDFAYVLSSIGTIARVKLAANTTAWVRTDALSDTPATWADTPAGAFQTWQGAVDAVRDFDFNGFRLTIQGGAEGSTKTFTQAQIVVREMTGGGQLFFRPSTDGTILRGTSGLFALNNVACDVFFANFDELSSTGSAYGTIEISGSRVRFDTTGPTFGDSDGADVFVHDLLGQVYLLNVSWATKGTKVWCLYSAFGEVRVENSTCDFPATTHFAAFVTTAGGRINSSTAVFTNTGNIASTGPFTGTKWIASQGGTINTFNVAGGPDLYWPGLLNGVQTDGGIYIDLWNTNAYLFPAGLYLTNSLTLAYSNPIVVASKSASGESSYFLGAKLGVSRWQWILGDATAEAGSNAGSDAVLNAMDDAGGLIGTTLKAYRKTRYLQSVGGFGTTVPLVVSDATKTVDDVTTSIIADRAGTVTLTLPAYASYPGRFLIIKTIQAQTVVSNASDVIPLAGGAAGTAILAATAGKFAMLQSDGVSGWQTMLAN